MGFIKGYHDTDKVRINGLKGGLKSKIISQKNLANRITNYLKNPKLCKQCNGILDYKIRKNKFCNHSCSASFNNKIRTIKSYKLSEEGLKNIQDSSKRRSQNNEMLYNKKSNHCIICNVVLCYKNRDLKCCSDKCLTIARSNTAKRVGLGGNKNRHAFWYESKIAGTVWLESSYELNVAKELDYHDIDWIRPKSISWIDTFGKQRRYHPDFYLVNYDVYLDPKNDYLIKQDREKIERVQKQNDVNILILDKNNLTWDCIKMLLKS